jgi:hypothetical protein
MLSTWERGALAAAAAAQPATPPAAAVGTAGVQPRTVENGMVLRFWTCTSSQLVHMFLVEIPLSP